MAKPRVTATDRLANVIEVVELGQRTGLLSAERGSGSVLEEGELYFSSGRVIYAALAGLRGREALAVLSRWGPCRFSFDRDAAPPIANIVGTQPSMPGSQPGYGAARAMEQSGGWPAQPSYDETASGYGANGYGNGNGYNGNGNGYGGTGYNGNGYNGYPSSFPPRPARGSRTGPLAFPPQTRALPTDASLQGGTGGFAVFNRRPRRAPDVRDLMTVVTTHNLSRGHRTILLLADGEHTVLDLARLSSKSVDEVSTLLNELEARGLVYYYAE